MSLWGNVEIPRSSQICEQETTDVEIVHRLDEVTDISRPTDHHMSNLGHEHVTKR